jgi:hypothetical protein
MVMDTYMHTPFRDCLLCGRIQQMPGIIIIITNIITIAE